MRAARSAGPPDDAAGEDSGGCRPATTTSDGERATAATTTVPVTNYSALAHTLHTVHGYPRALLPLCTLDQLAGLLDASGASDQRGARHEHARGAPVQAPRTQTDAQADAATNPRLSSNAPEILEQQQQYGQLQLPEPASPGVDERATLRFVADRTGRNELELADELSHAQFLLEARRAVDAQIADPTPLRPPASSEREHRSASTVDAPVEGVAIESDLPSRGVSVPPSCSGSSGIGGDSVPPRRLPYHAAHLTHNVLLDSRSKKQAAAERRPLGAAAASENPSARSVACHHTPGPPVATLSSPDPSWNESGIDYLPNCGISDGRTRQSSEAFDVGDLRASAQSPSLLPEAHNAQQQETPNCGHSAMDVPHYRQLLQQQHPPPPVTEFQGRPVESPGASWDDGLFAHELSKEPAGPVNTDTQNIANTSRVSNEWQGQQTPASSETPTPNHCHGDIHAFPEMLEQNVELPYPTPVQHHRQRHHRVRSRNAYIPAGDPDNIDRLPDYEVMPVDERGDHMPSSSRQVFLHRQNRDSDHQLRSGERVVGAVRRESRSNPELTFSRGSNNLILHSGNDRPQFADVPADMHEAAQPVDRRAAPVSLRHDQPRHSDRHGSAQQRHVPCPSPPPSPPISPSLPPIEAPSVVHALDELCRTGPMPRSRLSRFPHHSSLHRSVSMPGRQLRLSSRVLTPVEEIMQEADLLRREIRMSHRLPTDREQLLLDVFEERREYLKRREKSLLHERRDSIHAGQIMNRMYGSAGYPEQGLMSGGLPQPHMPLVPPQLVSRTPMQLMHGPSPMIPPPGHHFPDGGRAMLSMGQAELLTRPPLLPMMHSNDSPMVPMFSLHEDELEFLQGGMRHPANSTEMLSEDLMSPGYPLGFHPMMSPPQNWHHFSSPNSKPFLHFSTISDDMWQSNIPEGS